MNLNVNFFNFINVLYYELSWLLLFTSSIDLLYNEIISLYNEIICPDGLIFLTHHVICYTFSDVIKLEALFTNTKLFVNHGLLW